MGKLKPKWVKTDIPKDTKIKLWRIMKDNPTYESWQLYIGKHPELFTKDEEQYVRMSRDTYKRLQDEVRAMPYSEVLSLPKDLQDWILGFRPELKQQLGKQDIEQSEKLTNWIDDHRLKQGEFPLIPDFIVPLVKDYSSGARVSKGIKLNISPPYWSELLPSEQEQVLQLVEWLGGNRQDYLEMIKRRIPGSPSNIRIIPRRKMP